MNIAVLDPKELITNWIKKPIWRQWINYLSQQNYLKGTKALESKMEEFEIQYENKIILKCFLEMSDLEEIQKIANN